MALTNLTKELMTKRPPTTPASAPHTPYQRAEEIWNDRQGSLIKNAANWRKAFFATLVFAGALVAGLVYESTRLSVVPYFVEVNRASGEVHVVGNISQIHYVPGNAETAYFLSKWVEWVRSVPLDPVLVKQRWLSAYAFMRQSAANELNQWARTDHRLTQIGQQTVAVQVRSAVPIANSKSYQVRWHEIVRNAQGAIAKQYDMTGTFTVDYQIPHDVKTLSVNPIGLYIVSYQWARDNP
ncbi:MAG: conjugal transfer protein TrbF [Betaproteobacteria bacterium]|nr:conjugal transfer protein TrbF [Betaproteobacteria bacterium]